MMDTQSATSREIDMGEVYSHTDKIARIFHAKFMAAIVMGQHGGHKKPKTAQRRMRRVAIALKYFRNPKWTR